MNHTLKQYKDLLQSVDDWFAFCSAKAGPEISCRRACTGCCRGLFEISLLDARLLQEGYTALPADRQRPIKEKAEHRLRELQERWPELQPPYILNNLPHDEWQEMPEDDMTPCPLLSGEGLCLVYDHRPLTCRLHGLPNIDVSGEIFSDEYCSLNFRNSDPLQNEELRWGFRKIFAEEFELLGAFSKQLTGRRQLELDTFIPTALLIDFSSPDWQNRPAVKNDRGI